MTPTHLLASVAFIAALIAIVEKIYREDVDWKKSLKLVALIALAVLAYFTFKPFAEVLVDNVFGRYYSVNPANTKLALRFIAILAATGILWFTVTTYFITPKTATQKYLLAFSAAFIGLSYLCESLVAIGRAVPAVDKQHILYASIAVVAILLSVTLFLHGKTIQEMIAIPVGFVLTCCIGIYAYYNYSGINILEDMTTDYHSAGGIFIVVAIAMVSATVFYRSKPWHDRLSYKAVALLQFALFCYGMFSTAAFMMGAMNKNEWQATQAVNIGRKVVLEKKVIEDLNSEVDGFTMDSAMEVFKNPKSTAEEAQRALRAMEEIRNRSSKTVAEQEEIEFTGNTKRMENWFDHKLPFIGKSVKYVERKWDEFNQPKPKTVSKPQAAKANVRTVTKTGIGNSGGLDGFGGIEIVCNGTTVRYGQTISVVEGHPESKRCDKCDGNDGYYKFYQKQMSRLTGNDCIFMRAPAGETFTVAIN